MTPRSSYATRLSLVAGAVSRAATRRKRKSDGALVLRNPSLSTCSSLTSLTLVCSSAELLPRDRRKTKTAANEQRRLNAAFKSYLDSRTTVPRPRPGGGSRDAARPPTALPAKKELARMQRLRAAPVRFEHDRSLSRRG